MENVVHSPFAGAVMKNGKTKCSGDGKSTGGGAHKGSKGSY